MWKSGGGYHGYHHNLAKITVFTKENLTFFLCGHAYNPFTMETDEEKVLARIAESYGKPEYQDRIDEITGIYVYGVVNAHDIEFLVDPSGMQSAFYGKIGNHFYITSHSQLVGDLNNLYMNALTKGLLDYKWYYRVMGPYLPGDMTQFDEVKRIVPSHVFTYSSASVSHKRF